MRVRTSTVDYRTSRSNYQETSPLLIERSPLLNHFSASSCRSTLQLKPTDRLHALFLLASSRESLPKVLGGNDLSTISCFEYSKPYVYYFIRQFAIIWSRRDNIYCLVCELKINEVKAVYGTVEMESGFGYSSKTFRSEANIARL